MIGFLLRAGLRMLVLAGALYLAFFVPLGDHTFYGHLRRVASTNEAQELTGEFGQLFDRLAERARTSFADLGTQPAKRPSE